MVTLLTAVVLSLIVGRHPHQLRVRQRAHTSVLAAHKGTADMPPLNVDRYGKGSCLHVAPTGVRRVCRTTELPKQPRDSVRLIIISDTHSQVRHGVVRVGICCT